MKLTAKTLMMFLITSIATAIADTGFPHGIEWAVLGISLLGTSLVHISQSILLPTNTAPGDLNWRDILKGGIVAVGNFFAQFGASYLPGSDIHVGDMAQSAGIVFIMYMIKQLATKPPVKE